MTSSIVYSFKNNIFVKILFGILKLFFEIIRKTITIINCNIRKGFEKLRLPDRMLYNLDKLVEIAQGDQEFIHDMLVTFVENVTAEIGNIRSYQSAGNWNAIAEAAHKLASNFAYLNAGSLHELAANIEKSVLYDHDLTGISDKTDQLCQHGLLMVDRVKNDFGMTN